jgi:hypothetical protein
VVGYLSSFVLSFSVRTCERPIWKLHRQASQCPSHFEGRALCRPTQTFRCALRFCQDGRVAIQVFQRLRRRSFLAPLAFQEQCRFVIAPSLKSEVWRASEGLLICVGRTLPFSGFEGVRCCLRALLSRFFSMRFGVMLQDSGDQRQFTRLFVAGWCGGAYTLLRFPRILLSILVAFQRFSWFSPFHRINHRVQLQCL